MKQKFYQSITWNPSTCTWDYYKVPTPEYEDAEKTVYLSNIIPFLTIALILFLR